MPATGMAGMPEGRGRRGGGLPVEEAVAAAAVVAYFCFMM
jgi:hypothetical protein